MYNNPNLKIEKLVYTGILPNSLSNLTEEQTKIYNDVLTSNLRPEKLIEKYINYSNIKTKQLFIFKKIKAKKSQRGHVMVDPNLKPEDIIVNEYCPFFNTKIDFTSKKGGLTKNKYSIDRIDNSKMYMKGNIWVISRFANAMKNDSTLHELKTFSVNIIKQILDNKKNVC
jgi:hypothetical protein